MTIMNLSDIATLNVKSAYYSCIITGSSKNNAISLMQNADLTKKPNIIKHKKFLSYIKMGKVVLTFGNIAIEKSKF